MEKHYSVCPLDCPDSCGLVVTVDDGRVVSLHGDPNHPYTNGFICRKMKGYPERFYSAERIIYPQLRVGPKGKGEFKRISWDEAFALCAERLGGIRDEFGGDSILPYSYAGNMGAVNRFAGYPFFHKLGALQLKQTICSAAAGAGWEKHCGKLPGSPPENAADSRLIVAWGINIKVSNLHFWQYVSRARKKGARLLVIDPYRNQTARSADEYIRVRPGGDVGLALGICKVLVQQGKINRIFINEFCEGYAEFARYLETLSLADCARDAGLDAETIYHLAELLAANPAVFIRIGIGLSRHSRGGMAIRCITALGALLGLYHNGAGAGVLLSSGAYGGDKEVLVGSSLLEKETETVNMIQLAAALTSRKKPIKGLIVYNANPVSVNPDASRVRKGLAREDLFTVVHEQVMTPTAMYADLLLPATTFLENHDIYTGYGHYYLGVARPVVENYGEAMSNFDFFQRLAREMGFTDPVFFESCEERLAKYIATIRELPRDAAAGLRPGVYPRSTRYREEGDVFAAVNTRYRFLVTDDLAEPAVASLTRRGESDDPDLRSRYPLHLITPPHTRLLNSTFGERYKGLVPDVLINPLDAEKYGVEGGAEVLLRNHRGATKRRAVLSSDTAEGVVVAEGIFWVPPDAEESAESGGGINDLTSQKLSDMGGGATFHESLVAIAPCSGGK